MLNGVRYDEVEDAVPPFKETQMSAPFILIVMFMSAGFVPGRLDHIDSIRFDNKKACELAAYKVHLASTTIPPDPNAKQVRTECVPASVE